MEEFEKHRTRIFDAIESGSLLVICGAGLSMSPPSNLPSAVKVAEECYKNYGINDNINPNDKEDISKIAEHYYKLGTDSFETFLLNKIPWKMFSGEPNDGHATLADLLLCNALGAVLSTNFDSMIERWVNKYTNIDFPVALDGEDAESLLRDEKKPLMKIHGCMHLHKERKNTLWTHLQLKDEVIDKRLNSTKRWLKSKLPNKHLIVIGFWTDWSYLNDVIEKSLKNVQLKSVIVVDPESEEVLKNKAGNLWKILDGKSKSGIQHVKRKSDEFLNFLRIEFSKRWMKVFYNLDSDFEKFSHKVEEFEPDQLYNFRKDIEGVDYNQVSRWIKPEESAEFVLKAHVKLLKKGATLNGSIFEIKGKRIRVINSSGKSLDKLIDNFIPSELTTDIVLCAGIPEGEIRESMMGDDSSIRWLTETKTFEELDRIQDARS